MVSTNPLYIQGDSLNTALSPDELKKRALIEALQQQDPSAAAMVMGQPQRSMNNGTPLGAFATAVQGGMAGHDMWKKDQRQKQADMVPWMPTVTKFGE